MNPSDAPERPAGREDVVFRQLDDEWVLYDPGSNKLHTLNLTAALVWTHCDGTRTTDDLATAVGETYEQVPDLDRVVSDVAEVVARLHAEGLFT